MLEIDGQNTIRIEAAKIGMPLWRNNVGVLLDKNGRPVRFGLGNDSEAMNKKIKSGDLIGIYNGQFISIECKPEGWQYTGKGREEAQWEWIKTVRRFGGAALFATSWVEVRDALNL